MEMKLSQLWASVLGIGEVNIGADDSFFRWGGDSITAMQLAGLARDQGFSLTVEDIFTHPRLSNLVAIMMEDSKQGDDAVVGPFDLLRGVGEIIARQKSAALRSVDPLQVEDVFPCMPMQAGLLALTT
jgi:aryl carrier-like protein